MLGTNMINRILPLSVLGLTGLGITAQTAPMTGITVTSTRAKILSVSAAASQSATHGTISSNKKVLTFSQKTVRLVARSGPSNDMLSYRIDGLRNPMLVVPAGATVKVLYINTDDDMTHNLRFGLQHSGSAPSVGTPNLAHKTETAFRSADVTLQMPPKPGTYYYFCTTPGHAAGGMWGAIKVR